MRRQRFRLVSEWAEPGKFAMPTGTQCGDEEQVGGQICSGHWVQLGQFGAVSPGRWEG